MSFLLQPLKRTGGIILAGGKTLFLAAAFLSLLLTSCHDDESEEPETTERTVLVYVAGDNDLTFNNHNIDYFAYDLKQMMEATKTMGTNNKLIVFVDHYRSKPYFLKVERGDTVRLKSMPTELNSGDPETLYDALKYTIDNYPAKSYGLVLWGHSDGWLTRSGSAGGPRRAYGKDAISGNKWMNIPDMARVLERLPKLRFIFADCCAFLCVENVYELRRTADYIIGSPAEIPGEGAPYQTVTPALFSTDSTFYKEVIDRYYEQKSEGYDLPLAVVKSSEMDLLAQATATTLASLADKIERDETDGCRYPTTDGLIFYYDHTQFDMQDFMLRYAAEEQYTEWKRVFDKAVPYRTFARVWMARHIYNPFYTKFPEFQPTEERQGALGMFLPQRESDTFLWYSMYVLNLALSEKTVGQLNSDIKDMQWYEAARLSEMGW